MIFYELTFGIFIFQTPSCTCDTCHKSFSTKFNFRRHAISHHEDPKHECRVCTKKFHLPSQLKVHMRSHSKETTYLCPQCGLGFYVNYNLQRHIESVHEKLKPFQCSKCPMRYNRKETLINHEIIA